MRGMIGFLFETDKVIGVVVLGCLVATVAMGGVLAVASVDCVTDRTADILEKCAHGVVPLSTVNALTLALYCVATMSSICLLLMCYRHARAIGFPGLGHRLLASFQDPKDLSSQLVVWGLSVAFMVACVVEFGVGLSSWELVALIGINLVTTNAMTAVLGPLDLGPLRRRCSSSSLPDRRHTMNGSGTNGRRLRDARGSDNGWEEEEQPVIIDDGSGNDDDEEVAQDHISHADDDNNSESRYLISSDHGLDRFPRTVFLMGLATSLVLNGFFLCYDAAVVALRAAYRGESDESARERALLLLSSLASVWYRAFHARFSYHKLLFPSRDVLAARFPRVRS